MSFSRLRSRSHASLDSRKGFLHGATLLTPCKCRAPPVRSQAKVWRFGGPDALLLLQLIVHPRPQWAFVKMFTCMVHFSATFVTKASTKLFVLSPAMLICPWEGEPQHAIKYGCTSWWVSWWTAIRQRDVRFLMLLMPARGRHGRVWYVQQQPHQFRLACGGLLHSVPCSRVPPPCRPTPTIIAMAQVGVLLMLTHSTA